MSNEDKSTCTEKDENINSHKFNAQYYDSSPFYGNQGKGDETRTKIYEGNENYHSANQPRMNNDNNLLTLKHIERRINENHYRIILKHGGIHEVGDEIFERHLNNSYSSSTETLETILDDADSSVSVDFTTDSQLSDSYLIDVNNSDSMTFRSTEKEHKVHSNFIDRTMQFLYKKAEDEIYCIDAIIALAIKNWFNIIEIRMESFVKSEFFKNLKFLISVSIILSIILRAIYILFHTIFSN
uniref:Miff domain-containing protein n=1 Tax=Strongyloides papillosus TaxID=174720 RepID=A0A0N5CCH1_STREA